MTKDELLRVAMHLLSLMRCDGFIQNHVEAAQIESEHLDIQEHHYHGRWSRGNLKQLYRSLMAERRFAEGFSNDEIIDFAFALAKLPDASLYDESLEVPQLYSDNPKVETVDLTSWATALMPQMYPSRRHLEVDCSLHDQRIKYVIDSKTSNSTTARD
jgi:hypothetical protein